ncbi:methyltransferase MTA70, putative [Babesia caballi]|uniref:Methyltransferase MTA70, putative n=1 Tax=Babesia caballi TaxID=5871 RepID=A0AAV4LPX0_BABCB|nr:methyltransferase MTA70, putative [Babesia caballi]
MGRRPSRSRSRSRSRSPWARKSRKRKDRAARRLRDDSPEPGPHWRPRNVRRGGGHERDGAFRKAQEEISFLSIGPDSHVFSMLDLIFVVSKHLLALHQTGAFPLNVYELRRGMSKHFEGPHKLRFNTVCNIGALCAILKYLHMGDLEEPPAAEEKAAQPKRRSPRRREGPVVDVPNTHDDEGEADKGKDDVGDGESQGSAVDTNDDPLEEPKAATPLSIFLNQVAEVPDQSYREFKFHHSLVDLDVHDGVLHVLDANGQLLKRFLLRNRKRQRTVDLGDSLLFSADLYSDSSATDSVAIDPTDSIASGANHTAPARGTHPHGGKDTDKDKKELEERTNPADSTDTDADGRDGYDERADRGRACKRRAVDGADHPRTSTALSTASGNLPYDLDALYRALYQNTAREMTRISHFQLKEKSGFREICVFGTHAECRMQNPMAFNCKKIHFKRIVLPNTLLQLGDCSYLDTCRHIETCRFVHYQVESEVPLRPPVDEVSQGQWICCDVRKLDFSIFNPYVSVVMADPPWDIHMDLPYGTMKDSEMRHLKVQNIHNEGLLFLWVTGRTLEVGRECMEIWGYRQMDEIVWVKTNQLQRIIRTGRTGHWLNHSKEHCLIGVKGNPVINRYLDCDVVVSEVRETSRKPDEIYGLIERMAPGALKLEIFGRSHNVRNNWITLGNQLDGYKLTHPEIKRRYEEHMVRLEAAAAPSTANTPSPLEEAPEAAALDSTM